MFPANDDLFNRVQSFIDDMNKIGIRVVGINTEGTRIRILLDTQPAKGSEQTKGGDADKNDADTQS